MSAQARYTPYHPRWFRRRVSVWWWLQKGTYAVFVLRELTSVAVAFASLLTLLLVRALARGPEAYQRFLERLGHPDALVLSLLAMAFVLFHSVTWFHLAPKAMVVRFQGRRLPDALIVGANYLAWVALSGVVALVLLRGSG
jgi:fumarate reductase subunit C